MKDYQGTTTIKQWSEDDRPREKLLLKGKSVLSNAELIAVLLGSGSRNRTAVDLAKEVLEKASNNLSELSRMSVNDLKKVKGVGTVKALSIVVALELGRRRRSEEALTRQKITSSKDVFEIMHGILSDAAYEEFWILLLSRNNRLLQRVNVSAGGLSGTVADPKKIFKISLEYHAASVILCHNHPSGNRMPSEADIQLTRKMTQGGKLLDLPVLDHVIIGNDEYYSFADEGML